MAARKKKLTHPLTKAWSLQEMFCQTDGPFTLLPHRLSLSDCIKETGIQTQKRWFFRDTILPSSPSAGFLNKVVFLASTPGLQFIGLSGGEQSKLGLVTVLPDIANLCPLSFFLLIIFARVLPILLIFSNNYLLYSLIFLCFSIFYSIDFLSDLYFSFLLLSWVSLFYLS